MTTLGNFIGTNLEEEFVNFDLTEIQEVLSKLQSGDPIDLAHAEQLQQMALRGSDILIEYMGKVVKTVGYLESRVNSIKNKVALEFTPKEGKATMDMRRFASESSPEVEEVQIRLAKAKASKIVLDKKYDTLVRCHYHMKDIAMGLRRTILGQPGGQSTPNVANGWE